MKVRLNDHESALPVTLTDEGGVKSALTLAETERLRDDLAEAVAAICRHFRCTDESGTKSMPGFRCYARGSVKQPDGTYLCKRHAKKAAKEPK